MRHRASTPLQKIDLVRTFQMEAHFRVGVVVEEDGGGGGGVAREEGASGDGSI